MTIGELKQLRILASEIKAKHEVLKEAKANAYRITQIVSNVPKKNNGEGFSHAVLKAMMLAEEMQDVLNTMIEEFSKLYESATQEISKVGNVQERMILEYRYLAYKSWYEISSLMHFSKRRVLQLHKNAIKHFT